ncbi:MAG: IMPACT family protein [Chloroflexota bacterium]
MANLSEYISVVGAGEAAIEIKRSRFIGLAAPVADEEAARALLASVRDRQRGANHNAYAYRVGLGAMTERASDDGEPAGTAGRPLLEILGRRGLRNVIVIVTRYFGGTLLGAGGLLRAYSQAGAAAIDAAGVARYCERAVLAVSVDYPLWSKVEHELGRQGIVTRGVEYTDRVTVRALVAPAAIAGLSAAIRDMTAGSAVITEERREYVAVD